MTANFSVCLVLIIPGDICKLTLGYCQETCVQVHIIEMKFVAGFSLEWHAFCVQLLAQLIGALDYFVLIVQGFLCQRGELCAQVCVRGFPLERKLYF